MKKYIKKLTPFFLFATVVLLPSCLGSEYDYDYTDWRNLNAAYIDSVAALTEDGKLVYTPVTPVWDKSFTIFMKWHNEEENSSAVTPLSTSTCHVKYTLTNISGDTLDSSAGYSCIPNEMITGFMAALCSMRVNDTVTAVIPYTAGYGIYGSSNIYPYSTLIFDIRLDSISNLM